MTDRQLIMQSVLEGKLSIDHVTLEEVQELQELLFNLVTEKHVNRGKLQ